MGAYITRRGEVWALTELRQSPNALGCVSDSSGSTDRFYVVQISFGGGGVFHTRCRFDEASG